MGVDLPSALLCALLILLFLVGEGGYVVAVVDEGVRSEVSV